MFPDTFIQWGMTFIVFGWLAAIVGLSFFDWQAERRHKGECRALKEAREIVERHWTQERMHDEAT